MANTKIVQKYSTKCIIGSDGSAFIYHTDISKELFDTAVQEFFNHLDEEERPVFGDGVFVGHDGIITMTVSTSVRVR